MSQLTWLGIDSASVQALQPYVVLLGVQTPVNVNTASQEVLAAVIKGLDLATAEHLVQVRQRTPFKDIATAFAAQVPGLTLPTTRLDVRSSYFDVRGRLRLVDRVLVERSLVHRLPNGVVEVMRRERIASLDQVSG